MNTKIIFCHLPKTGGYSLLNWFRKDLQLYEFNDSARLEPLDLQIEKYQNASIVEIHGLKDIDHLRSSAPTTDELFISIIRNPVEQFESLCRDAYIHKAYLDLPLSPRSFNANDIDSIYEHEYKSFEFDISRIFNLYYDYWSKFHGSSFLDDDIKFFNWLHAHASKELTLTIKPNYLFRRNSQSQYILNSIGSYFIQQVFSEDGKHILLTTEQLNKQFIWLLSNHEILKDLSIFSEYKGVYSLSDIESKLRKETKNITPKIATKINTKLSTYESYLYSMLNQTDHNIWHAITCHWNHKFAIN